MLILIAISLSVILGSVSIGSLLVKSIGLTFEEKMDEVFANFWLGFSLFLIASITAVAVVALRFVTLPAAILTAFLVVCGLRRLGRPNLSLAGTSTTVLIILLVALAACQPSRLYDSGAYHYQIIAWYRSYGAVPGVALLNHHLGFTSSLFALTAIAEAGPLGELGNLVNASGMIVSLLFGASKLFSAYRGDTRPSVLYWPLCMIVAAPIWRKSVFNFSRCAGISLRDGFRLVRTDMRGRCGICRVVAACGFHRDSGRCVFGKA